MLGDAIGLVRCCTTPRWCRICRRIAAGERRPPVRITPQLRQRRFTDSLPVLLVISSFYQNAGRRPNESLACSDCRFYCRVAFALSRWWLMSQFRSLSVSITSHL